MSTPVPPPSFPPGCPIRALFPQTSPLAPRPKDRIHRCNLSTCGIAPPVPYLTDEYRSLRPISAPTGHPAPNLAPGRGPSLHNVAPTYDGPYLHTWQLSVTITFLLTIGPMRGMLLYKLEYSR